MSHYVVRMSTVIQMPEPSDIKAVIAGEVKALMGRYGVSQKTLAEHLEITQSQMSKRLSGRITIDVVELGRIADFFGVPVAHLVGGMERPSPSGPGQRDDNVVRPLTGGWTTGPRMVAYPTAA